MYRSFDLSIDVSELKRLVNTLRTCGFHHHSKLIVLEVAILNGPEVLLPRPLVSVRQNVCICIKHVLCAQYKTKVRLQSRYQHA